MENLSRNRLGLHLTPQWCEELIEQLRRIPAHTFDGIISSGRNGGYLKGYLDGSRSADLPEWALVRSISNERDKGVEWAKLTKRQLRNFSNEIGDLIGCLLPQKDGIAAKTFEDWHQRCFGGRRPSFPALRFLFVDDSVSAVPNGTLAFVRSAVAAWGCQLTGWIATDHLLSNGMGGFHPIRHFDPLFLINQGESDEARRTLENREPRDPWEETLLHRIRNREI